MLTPRRVLITGGAGFLGGHVARRFRREGIRVRLLDVVGTPDWACAVGVEHVVGDVREPAAVAAALEGVDAVVHAAFAPPRHPVELIYSVNVGGTRTVLEQAVAQGVRRLVVISSPIVLKERRVHPVFRDSPLTRLDAYRASRAEAEAVAESYSRRGLPVAIARPKTLVGPERVGAFALIFESIRLGRAVPVLGDGWNRYQLLDIRDMAEGIHLLAASEASGVFAFGAREFGRVREDWQTLLDHARTGSRLRFVPGRLARVSLRAMELANVAPLSEWHYMSASGKDSVVDIGRAERELSWRPERSNARALVEAYDWYVENVRATGTARTTHPLPRAHRTLKRLQWFFLR